MYYLFHLLRYHLLGLHDQETGRGGSTYADGYSCVDLNMDAPIGTPSEGDVEYVYTCRATASGTPTSRSTKTSNRDGLLRGEVVPGPLEGGRNGQRTDPQPHAGVCVESGQIVLGVPDLEEQHLPLDSLAATDASQQANPKFLAARRLSVDRRNR